MKLYYTPGACSMAAHIALREAGLDFDLEKVDLAKKTTDQGNDYAAINPKGYVPALQLNNGELLTECGVIIQYVADQKPGSGLAPAAGSMERYRLMELIHFISTELHKNFSVMFKPDTPDAMRKTTMETIGKRLGTMNEKLAGHDYLLGSKFSVADGYLATVLNWTNFLKMDLSPWPNLAAFLGRVMSRPKVQETLKAEGLA